jgi:hypothetical protein
MSGLGCIYEAELGLILLNTCNAEAVILEETMPGAFNELVANALLVVGALFPIVNPLGNTPIFLTLTRGLSRGGRASLARMIALNGFLLMLASIFIGTHILAFFGISLPVVQVAGVATRGITNGRSSIRSRCPRQLGRGPSQWRLLLADNRTEAGAVKSTLSILPPDAPQSPVHRLRLQRQ